jgi:hypothetical protein
MHAAPSQHALIYINTTISCKINDLGSGTPLYPQNYPRLLWTVARWTLSVRTKSNRHAS